MSGKVGTLEKRTGSAASGLISVAWGVRDLERLEKVMEK